MAHRPTTPVQNRPNLGHRSPGQRGFVRRLRCEALEDRRLLAIGDLVHSLPDANFSTQSWMKFGQAVAVNDQYTVVGAPNASGGGCAYVFDASGSLWKTLANPTPFADDNFGCSVAVSGTTIVVGASGDDTGSTDSGAAYVFDATTGNLLHTLANPTPAVSDLFGNSVAINGTKIVVGAMGDDTTNASNAGSAYVFDISSSDLRCALPNPWPDVNDYFGYSVAIYSTATSTTDSSTVVVGAYGEGGYSGAAYVYHLDFTKNTAALVQVLANPTPSVSDYFGCSVAISDSKIVVGANGDDTSVMDAGSAYVFNSSTGALIRTLANPTPVASDSFGFSVGISGTTVVVGAIGDDTGATDSGSAYVMDATAGTLLATLANPTKAASDMFGYSVAISGAKAIVGTPGDDWPSIDRGAAYVFDVDRTPTNIILSDTAVAENQPVGTVVGTLSATDPNVPGDIETYTLVSGTGSDNNGYFSISGNQLLTAATFDYETKTSYSIRVRTTDAGGLYYEKAFTINVTDVDDFDRVAVGFGGSVGTWFWKQPGTWTWLHNLTPVWIVSGDLDGNGKADLVVNFGGTMGIWIYHDTGEWQYLHSATSTTAAMADIDGDNRTELILTISQADFAGVWAYDAAQNTWTCLAGWQAEGFAVGNFDDNGKQDVAVDFGQGKGLWFWNNNTAWQYVHDVNPGWMAAGDLDGDGKTDLAMSVTGANYIWARLDSGSWQFIESMTNSTATAADANGDGKAELFLSITDPAYAGLWEYAMPARSWKYTNCWSPESLTSADVDGNGKKDVVADFGTNGLWVYKNDAAWQRMQTLDPQVMTGTQFGQALMADTAIAPVGQASILTMADLEPIVAEAKRRLALSTDTTFEIADLPEGILGEAIGHRILIDRDAAGYGWFVDHTPGDDVEFSNGDPAAAQRMDLLTTVMHELGHTAGLSDLDASVDSLMSGRLKVGVRRV